MFDIDALDEPAFSWRTALSMALASQLAYADKATVIATAEGWGFDDVRHLASKETQGFVATTPHVALLAFRGTESVGDWMANIRIVATRKAYGRVHRGFYNAFKDVRDEVRQILTDGGFRHVFFCGHSLGGALATIAMAELQDIEAAYKAGYTCGQPKTGKKSFRGHFEARYGDAFFRFVNDGDIVPRVPPSYRHVRVLHELHDGSGLESVPPDMHELSEAEFKSLQATVEAAMEDYRSREHLEGVASESEDEFLEGIIPGVASHAMELYVSRIQEKLDNDQ